MLPSASRVLDTIGYGSESVPEIPSVAMAGVGSFKQSALPGAPLSNAKAHFYRPKVNSQYVAAVSSNLESLGVAVSIVDDDYEKV